MTEGNKTARTARLALAATAALALAGVVGAGHAETSIALPAVLAGPVQDAATIRFQPSPQAERENRLAPVQVEPALSTPPAGAQALPGAEDDAAGEPDTRPLGSGMASFYGRGLTGHATASGERFDPHAFTAAHRTLPFGSRVRVTNPRNGRSVVVRINDRGPFSNSRLIDLSRGAAEEIGIVAAGHGKVDIALLLD